MNSILILGVNVLDMEGQEEDDQAADKPDEDEIIDGSDFEAEEDMKDAYVKQELQPRPYVSEFGDSTEKEVNSLIVKNTR